MSASVPVRVKVIKETEQWVDVYAVTLTEAKEIARTDPGVVRVVSAVYVEEEE